MNIRSETQQDYPQIYDLVKVAFQTAQVSNGKEQDFVDQLRAGGNYIPELALVCEEDGEMIGHSMLTKTEIIDGQNRLPALYLGPISVELAWRKRGVGSALIRESFRLAGDMGYTAVFLVGNPDYYRRFGFHTVRSFGLTYTLEIPEEVVLGCELAPGALDGVRGRIDCV